MRLARGLSAGALRGVTVKPAHRLNLVAAFCERWLEERPEDDESLPKSIITAHSMAQMLASTSLRGMAPDLKPTLALSSMSPSGIAMSLQDCREVMQMIVARMKETQEKERAGLGGGHTGEHDIKKLLKMFVEAPDHESAMECGWDIIRYYCIQAQRPMGEAILEIEIAISNWGKAVTELMRMDRNGQDGENDAGDEDDEDDEDKASGGGAC